MTDNETRQQRWRRYYEHSATSSVIARVRALVIDRTDDASRAEHQIAVDTTGDDQS